MVSRVGPPPKSPLLVTAIQLAFLLFFIYYIFIGGQTAHGIFDHRWRLISQWLTTLLIGSWLVWRLLDRKRVPRTRFDLPLLWLLGASILAGLLSVNQVYSREALVFLVVYLFFFYIAVDLGQRAWLRELGFNAIIGASGLVWTLGLLQLSWWYQGVVAEMPGPLQVHHNLLTSLPRLSVLGNPNTMASFIALVMPVVLYKLTTVRYWLTRGLLGCWVLMLALTGLLTQSRGGVLALLVAAGFYLVVWQLARPGGRVIDWVANRTGLRAGSGGRIWLWGALIGAAAVLVAGVAIWLILGRQDLGRATHLRQQILAGTLKTIAAHPLVGSGPGTLGEELIRRQQPLDVAWSDAHNLILTFVAETGLIGTIGLLWLGGIGLKILVDTFRKVDRMAWSLAGMACVAALLGFAIHNLVDSLYKYPLIMLLVVILAGFWMSSLPEALAEKRVWSYRAMAVAGVMLVAATFLHLQAIEQIEIYNQAIESAGHGDWAEAVTELSLVNQMVPGMPFYQRQLGFAAGYLAAEQPAYRTEAIDHYQQAMAQVGQLAIDQANLACLLWADGQQTVALDSMARAYQTQADRIYLSNLAYYQEITGQEEAAREGYKKLLTEQPELAQSDFWRQNSRWTTVVPQILEEASQAEEQTARLGLARLYFYTGNFEQALKVYDELLLETDGSAFHLGRAKALFELERYDEAKAELAAVLAVAPLTGEAYLYLAKIGLAQKELAAARQAAEAALFLNKNGETLYLAALLAEAEGDEAAALEQYEAAFETAVHQGEDIYLSHYATEVARRQPLPDNYLPCLIRLYPTPLLVAITEAEGALLEGRGDYSEASQVYRRLLWYEPGLQPIAARLDALCESHLKVCEN